MRTEPTFPPTEAEVLQLLDRDPLFYDQCIEAISDSEQGPEFRLPAGHPDRGCIEPADLIDTAVSVLENLYGDGVANYTETGWVIER